MPETKSKMNLSLGLRELVSLRKHTLGEMFDMEFPFSVIFSSSQNIYLLQGTLDIWLDCTGNAQLAVL